MVFITSYISGYRKILMVRPPSKSVCNHLDQSETFITYKDVLGVIYQKEGCCKDICLTHEGKAISIEDEFIGDVNIVATLRLRGGKGGFGSMLRAIGAQIEKTTNREACRDLSGRRLRDINEEKRLKEYLSKKVEKEKELFDEKKKKLEKLKEGPKHVFEDKAYFEQREKRERDIYDSLDKAFASSSQKRAHPDQKNGDTQKPVKKKRLIGDLDESSSDESDTENFPDSGKISQIEDSRRNVSHDTNEEIIQERKNEISLV